MATCTTASLVDAANCWTCVPQNIRQAIRIRLLCALINGEIVTCNIADLVREDSVKCYSCLPENQRDAVETYLVCSLVSAGGVAPLSGTVDPEGAVVASPFRFYINTTTHTLWIKESGSGSTGWRQYV